jgi:hypothetical protein
MEHRSEDADPHDRRLVGMAWGLFLVLAGIILLLKGFSSIHLDGSLMAAGGAVLILLNIARMGIGTRLSTTTLVIGAVLLLLGGAELSGRDLPLLPIVLIAIGAVLLVSGIREYRASD